MIESVAENTVDAVIAPLIWAAVAGAPGVLGHRAVNTLDAMVGHRNERYQDFGTAAARADDVANWPAARLAGLLVANRQAWGEGAKAHPSPNAGVIEAAFAGALGVGLGGTLAYAGQVEHRPVLNPGARAPTPRRRRPRDPPRTARSRSSPRSSRRSGAGDEGRDPDRRDRRRTPARAS